MIIIIIIIIIKLSVIYFDFKHFIKFRLNAIERNKCCLVELKKGEERMRFCFFLDMLERGINLIMS